jgi:hypothetical protein
VGCSCRRVKESDLANSLPECHPTQHVTQSTVRGGRGLFFKGLLHNRERILQVSSVNDVPLFPN